ncbi:MAG: DUF2125 domain-containing protein [Pseudomonadota bacterium]
MTVDTPRPSRFWLYAPFVIFGLLAAAYSAYWFWMRGELDKGIDAWIAEQRAAGNIVEYSEKKLAGYPYRFALSVSEPRFADRSNGVDWTGQELQLIMQPWNFYHVIGRSPGRNRFDLRGEEPITAMLSSKSVASLSWTDTHIERFSISLHDSDIILSDGPIELEEFSLSWGTPREDLSKIRLAVDASSISTPSVPESISWLGNTVDDLALRVEFTNVASFLARSNPYLPNPTDTDAEPSLDLAQLLINWGPVHLGAKGDIRLPAQSCTVDGIINIRLDEPDPLIGALRNAGQLTDEIETGISAVATVSENGGFAPITFREGDITFLGQAIAALPQYCGETAPLPAN